MTRTRVNTPALDARYAAQRAWAEGLYHVEAGVELLIRTAWALPAHPWVRYDHGRPWVDFEALPSLIGVHSGGEQRLLRIAASSIDGDAVPVGLADAVTGLDWRALRLVLAELAHANGTHQHPGEPQFNHAGKLTCWTAAGSLYPWPEDSA